MAKMWNGRAVWRWFGSVTESTIDESGHMLENLQADVRREGGGLSSWEAAAAVETYWAVARQKRRQKHFGCPHEHVQRGDGSPITCI